MSDAVLDRGVYFPSPMTDWYRERPFKVAFVVSLLLHAALLAFVPGFRAVVIEAPKVLNVEIILPEQPQVPSREDVAPLAPVTTPMPRAVEERAVRPDPRIELAPETEVRQPEPEPTPIPRAQIVPPPASVPLPEPIVVPKPEPRIEPKIEITPEPRIEPVPEPPPVPRAEPLPEPRTEVLPESQPVPRVEPPPSPPVAAATVEPAPVAVPEPPPVAEDAPAQRPTPRNSETVASEQLRRKQESFNAAASKRLRDTLNNAVYPVVTRKRTEWQLVLQVRVSAEGAVDVSVSEGSGERAIDSVVIRNLRRAPQDLRELVPPDLRGHAFSATVPIRIQIQKS